MSEASPLMQQTVIYTIRIYHPSNVSEINPSPVNIPGIALEKIDGPPDTSRSVGQAMMASEFRYALTALTEGVVDIPKVEITLVSGDRKHYVWNRFETVPKETRVSTNSLKLTVRPKSATKGPWLPLYGLRIDVNYDKDKAVRVGEPLRFTLTQTAWGVSGDRLPSLSGKLGGSGYKLYADAPDSSRMLAKNGRLLVGRKVETLTLVPERVGELRVPSLQVPWWSLEQGREVSAQWPGLALKVLPTTGGAVSPGGEAPKTSTEGISWLQGLALVLLGFAAGWWLRGGLWGAAAVSSVLIASAQRLNVAVNRLSARRAGGLPAPPDTGEQWSTAEEQGEASSTPRAEVGLSRRPFHGFSLRWLTGRFKFRGKRHAALRPWWFGTWLLRHRMKTAEEPRALEHDLQLFAHHALGLPVNTALPVIGKNLARGYPGVDEPRLTALLKELDAYLYGQGTEFDFGTWMYGFRRVLRKVGYRRPRLEHEHVEHGLPELNPRHSH